MKFLCVECDEQMTFEERQQPGDGTFAASFRCPKCGRIVAMLANPMETQLVGALGVQIGGETLSPEPLEHTRSAVSGADSAITKSAGGSARAPRWSVESKARLDRVPAFVRGMVKRIYNDWALAHGITEITPAEMDRARQELGLEGF